MVEKGMKAVIIMLVAVTMASVLAISGVLIFFLMDNEPGSSGPGTTNPTNNAMSDEALQAWLDYEGENVDDDARITDDTRLLNFTDEITLSKMAELEGQANFTNGESQTNTDRDSNGLGDYAEDDAAAPSAEKDAEGGGAGEPREIEEADIVKVIDDTMYVLNPYKGLMIVDVEDPDNAEVQGQVKVLGSPVEMYVVDFLAFVIVNTNYNYWYNYWMLEGDAAMKTHQSIGSKIVVINVYDPENPKVLKSFPLDGFSSDSRRVGDVIYVVTNTYSWWGYEGEMENEDKTYVTSINFNDPTSVGQVDQVEFTGSSNHIHVSESAIYVAQVEYNWEERWADDDVVVMEGDDGDEERTEEVEKEESSEEGGSSGSSETASSSSEEPEPAPPVEVEVKEEEKKETTDKDDYYVQTSVTYIDISDYKGDIKVRDEFRVPGYVENRYQMDEYDGHFRIVTHFWGDWGELGSSTLWIYDIRNPDDIDRRGQLDIDDAGSLMATRFAGDRGYTIHLPYSVDPLDVLDLKDPSNPKLCDVLEIPGWVEHMEVRGYKILALGVDDTDGNKVAVSLFDVTDPYKAVLEDRVTIGDKYSWSNANWDDKVLSVIDDQQIMLVPYSSYDRSTYTSTNGVQIVSFDLEKGDLELNGAVETPMQVARTRAVNDRVIATSDTSLIVIDARVKDKPIVSRELQLASNVIDVFKTEGKTLEVVSNYYQETFVQVKGDNNAKVLARLDVDGDYGSFVWDEPYLYYIGYEYESGDWYGQSYFVKVYDFDDPLKPTERGTYTFNDGTYLSPWRTSSYTQTEFLHMLDDTHLVVYGEDNYKDNYYGEDDKVDAVRSQNGPCLYILDMSDPDTPKLDAQEFLDTEGWIQSMEFNKNKVYLTEYVYNYNYDDKGNYQSYYKYYLHTFDVSDPSDPELNSKVNIPGVLIGTDATGAVGYTISNWWEDEGSYTTLNAVSLGDNEAEILSALKLDFYLDSVVFTGNSIYITTGYNYYWYYDYCLECGRSSNEQNLLVISLEKASEPVLAKSLVLPETSRFVKGEGGYLFFDIGYGQGMLIYDITRPGDIGLLGLYMTQSYTNNVKVFSDSIYLMHGYYGMTLINLPYGYLM